MYGDCCIIQHEPYKHIVAYLIANDINKTMTLKLTPFSDKRYDYFENVKKFMVFFRLEQIKIVATVFYDKPTYVIMWISDWLLNPLEKLTDYRKIQTIEGVKNSISKVKGGVIL